MKNQSSKKVGHLSSMINTESSTSIGGEGSNSNIMSSANNNQQLSGSREMTSGKKVSTSCEQNNVVDNITEDLNSVALLDMSTCANCGKEGNSDDMNTCNKCQLVKYCNAACKKKHRTKHKKKCERRVAELHDEKLFKEVEPDECPICLLPLEIEGEQIETFQSCCGKSICNGCMYVMEKSEAGKILCPFCRTPPCSEKEEILRIKRLMEKGHADAHYFLGSLYENGFGGMPRNLANAIELWHKGAELGSAVACYNLGCAYGSGRGVERDEKKAKYYCELSAMYGDIQARHKLGILEFRAGNVDRGMKHLIIAARGGYNISLEIVREGFLNDAVTKDEYESTLRAHQKIQKEMKSDERDKAALVYSFARNMGIA